MFLAALICEVCDIDYGRVEFKTGNKILKNFQESDRTEKKVGIGDAQKNCHIRGQED